MTSKEKQDNFEEPPEDEELEGEPSLHEIMEFGMAVALDLENSLDEDEDPLEQVINVNINAGMLLYLAYTALDMYQVLEDMSDADMDALEQYVKTKKKTPNQNNLKH